MHDSMNVPCFNFGKVNFFPIQRDSEDIGGILKWSSHKTIFPKRKRKWQLCASLL